MAKSKRKTITKKLRFQIFERDSFTCKYCGKGMPDVILEVDHILPVSKGGDNDPLNLVTSCRDCNRGKSDKKLGDVSELKLQREQLEDIQEKRNQLKALAAWRKASRKLEDESVGAIEEEIARHSGCGLNETGRASVLKWLKTFNITEILNVVDAAYSDFDVSKCDIKDWNLRFGRIPKYARNNRRPPIEKDAHYTKAILRNRFDLNWSEQEQVYKRILAINSEKGTSGKDFIEVAKTCEDYEGFLIYEG